MIRQAKDWPLMRITSSARGGDPRRLQVHRPPPARDVPYVPSDDVIVEAMLDLAQVGRSDVVYDLGSGDGRIVLAAAKRGARAVGVDIDPQRIGESVENARQVRLLDRVQFRCQSFFDVDLREATVVTIYLLPSINRKLRPKLLWELRPGARVVSNNFDMDDWPADERYYLNRRTLYEWIVPAWVSGRWHCVINEPNGRQRMTLQLQRCFQSVTGTLRMDRRELAISEGRLVGDELSFRVPDPRDERSRMYYRCRVDGRYLRGTCHAEEKQDRPVVWGGVRA